MTRSDILNKYKQNKENLIDILHEIQNISTNNYLSTDDITAVSNYLNISVSSVYGVITYYSMFSLKPRAKNIIRVCESPVCEMKGSSILADEIRSVLAIENGNSTADGLFTIESSQCLGNCQSAPGFSINNEFFGVQDHQDIVQIIERFKSNQDV